jgi:hypothetical protein
VPGPSTRAAAGDGEPAEPSVCPHCGQPLAFRSLAAEPGGAPGRAARCVKLGASHRAVRAGDLDVWRPEVRMGTTSHFVSATCRGERCSVCGATATHKVGEEIQPDDPDRHRHNLTAYLCCEHFGLVLGPEARRRCTS